MTLSRQLPQPQPDQRLRLGLLAGLLQRGGDRRRGLRLGVAEIDQRRDGVRDRAPARVLSSTAPERRISAGSTAAKAGALSFSSETMRWASFGPTPGPRATEALSPVAMAVASAAGIEHGQDAERHLGADALDASAAAGTIRAPHRTGSRTGGSCPRAHGSRWRGPPPRRPAAGSGGCGRSNAPRSRRPARRGSRNPRRRHRPRP